MLKDLKIAPGAQKSWSLDWADATEPYLQPGETIISHEVDVSPGLTKVSSQLDGGKVLVWVEAAEGLREGQRATILIAIETSSTPARRDARVIPLECRYGSIA